MSDGAGHEQSRPACAQGSPWRDSEYLTSISYSCCRRLKCPDRESSARLQDWVSRRSSDEDSSRDFPGPDSARQIYSTHNRIIHVVQCIIKYGLADWSALHGILGRRTMKPGNPIQFRMHSCIEDWEAS